MVENGVKVIREKKGNGKCCCAISTIIVVVCIVLGAVAFVNREKIIDEFKKLSKFHIKIVWSWQPRTSSKRWLIDCFHRSNLRIDNEIGSIKINYRKVSDKTNDFITKIHLTKRYDRQRGARVRHVIKTLL